VPDHRRAAVEIERLYREHAPSLQLFAAAMTRNSGWSQDAVQQVFLKLMERGFPEVTDIKAYLFASVRNAILNDLRSQKREVVLDPDFAWFISPHRDYAEELNLRRALASLPGEQREVAVMHVWGELTFAQIAEVVGISPNTVASRYRYALLSLRSTLSRNEDACAHP
jgi:RNA polymerase sigma-70 factor (ECF subfamily)